MAWRKTFRPLKVTAHLRTGVVADRWLPLDGILLYQISKLNSVEQYATLPGGDDRECHQSMPLAVVHPGERNWYYACSWAQPQPWWFAEGCDHWNKRFDTMYSDLIDFGGRRGNVLIEKGRYKSYHMPVYYRIAIRIHWYCVGDRDEIEQLLMTVTHIGKKRVYGWGRVLAWEVTPWHADWSVWRDGRLTRGVPVEDAPSVTTRLHYGLRPGYYKPANQMTLAMPDERG